MNLGVKGSRFWKGDILNTKLLAAIGYICGILLTVSFSCGRFFVRILFFFWKGSLAVCLVLLAGYNGWYLGGPGGIVGRRHREGCFLSLPFLPAPPRSRRFSSRPSFPSAPRSAPGSLPGSPTMLQPQKLPFLVAIFKMTTQSSLFL